MSQRMPGSAGVPPAEARARDPAPAGDTPALPANLASPKIQNLPLPACCNEDSRWLDVAMNFRVACSSAMSCFRRPRLDHVPADIY